MSLDKWDKQTIEEWNQLGFYYEYHDDLKQWRFFGDRNGLLNFSKLIREYAVNPNMAGISEHMHIGPYCYLKIMTWHERVITRDYIAGSSNDLLELSNIIHSKIDATSVGEIFKVAQDYTKGKSEILLFVVMSDNFEPSSMEFSI